MIGYDIGIGTQGVVCVNLNNGMLLDDARELVSLVIHEAAHAAYEQARGPLPGIAGLDSGHRMRTFLDYYIQYEGYGVFAPAEYRARHGIPVGGTPAQQDYQAANDHGLRASLVREYRALASDLERSGDMTMGAFLQRGFGPSRLSHRLGYAIVDALHRANGLDAVRAAATIDSADFMMQYLPLLDGQ